MKEIGGYIELAKFSGREFHSEALALNTARNCVAYLIKAHKIKKLYIPLFLCDSVSDICKRESIETEFYSINENLKPVFRKELEEGEWLYIVNFYGQLSEREIFLYKKRYQNIILDNVQAFFSRPLKSVDTIYTCRKFFGVPDGAYMYTDCPEAEVLADTLETDLSYSRMAHILGRFEKTAEEFYSTYTSNECSFSEIPIRKMSKLTHNLLCGINYNEVRRIRTENFVYLDDLFSGINKLSLIVPDGPFMYPLYVENGGMIRKKLQQDKIFIPTLWADVFRLCSEDAPEYRMAENILPIPVDQRYNKEDMKNIADEVFEYGKFER